MKRGFTITALATLIFAGIISAADNNSVKISADASGFSIKGSNGYELQINGFGQSAGYFGVADDAIPYTNQFLLQRARLNIGARLGNHVEARVLGDFATSPLLLDAYLQVNLFAPLAIRFGSIYISSECRACSGY